MDYAQYRTNSPLGDEDRQNALPTTTRATKASPIVDGVLRVSDTYLEIVDQPYYSKGAKAPFIFLCITAACVFTAYLSLTALSSRTVLTISDIAFSSLFSSAPFIAGILWLRWEFKKGLFSYTHAPIILNRHNRTIYVFKHNGSNGVLAVPWDKLFFCIGGIIIPKRYDNGFRSVLAIVVDDDGIVRDAFGLGNTDHTIEFLQRKWAYFQLYMEKGVDAVPPPPCIVPGRETWRESFSTVVGWFGGGWLAIIFSPVILLQTTARHLGFLISKTPEWPADVKAACQW
ncbi:DUF6708 domain-containing protein [Andreprevotia chitinilytica]|uniref:DUF6708 domain-containing protein n=1 Tax=Andreprevotia chitinilytica TaxID=396808 RepID=UPI0012EB6256|nr:DUF6708 domain-containing protein [Andreprevotia chitinilytica]